MATEVDRWSRRSMFKAVLRQLKWLGTWAKDLLGAEAPEVKALAVAFRAFEAGLEKEPKV